MNYYKERPVAGVNVEYVSAHWTAILTPPASGEFTFSLRADDGVRLWIDDTKLIDAWIEQEATTYEGSISLEKDKKYKLKIEYYNSWLHSVLMLSWETPEDGFSLFGYKFFRTLKEVPSSVFTLDTDSLPSKKRQLLRLCKTLILNPLQKAHRLRHNQIKINSLKNWRRHRSVIPFKIQRKAK